MLENTKAIYFDGVSSTPHHVELFLNKEKKNLHFEYPIEEKKIWSFVEVDFNHKFDVIIARLKENEAESLQINDPVFILKLSKRLKETGNISQYQKFLNLGFKAHSFIAVALLGLVILCYFYVIPWVGEKSVALIPESYDTELGNLAFEQSFLITTIDTLKTEKLNLFAKELKLKNTKKLRFIVVDSGIVNAFALPNGTVVVYTGILDSMKGYEELVGLIGHEVSHINNRDSMKMLCRNLSGYLFISTVLGDANGVIATLGDNANTLQSLSFSREFEQQADLDGLEIIANNQVNPKGMSNLFKRLQEDSFNFTIPEFLSSHPVTEERIDYINKTIKSKSFIIRDNMKLKTLFEQIKK